MTNKYTKQRIDLKQVKRLYESGLTQKEVADIHGVMIQSHSPRTNDASLGGSGPLLSEEHCFTIDRTPHQVIQDFKIRRLTPIECERLQGFPDNWTEGFSDTQRYKMMGNAVTVNVIEAIFNKLNFEGNSPFLTK